MHPEILKWPNSYFYNNRLCIPRSKNTDTFPIVPYKIISYDPINMESDNVMLIIKALLTYIDWNTQPIGVICTNFKQNSIMQNKLR